MANALKRPPGSLPVFSHVQLLGGFSWHFMIFVHGLGAISHENSSDLDQGAMSCVAWDPARISPMLSWAQPKERGDFCLQVATVWTNCSEKLKAWESTQGALPMYRWASSQARLLFPYLKPFCVYRLSCNIRKEAGGPLSLLCAPFCPQHHNCICGLCRMLGVPRVQVMKFQGIPSMLHRHQGWGVPTPPEFPWGFSPGLTRFSYRSRDNWPDLSRDCGPVPWRGLWSCEICHSYLKI